MFPLVILGLALSLASMPNPLIYLPLGIFIGFVPLLILDQMLTGRSRFFANLLFTELLAIAMIIPIDTLNAVYLFPETLILIAIFAVMGLVYALMISLSSALSDKFSWNFSPIIFGISWTILQYSLSNIHFLLTFPLETALSKVPIMIQTVRIFGPYSVVFLIIFTNAILANAFIKKDKKMWIISLSILGIIHIVNLCYGYNSINSKRNFGEAVNIAVIQQDITSKDYQLMERSRFFEKIFGNNLIALSIDALKKQPKLVIWPELSGDYTLQDDRYLSYLQRTITSKGTELLIGTSYIDYCDNGKKYNIAFILKTDGDMTEPYRKTKIFPFFETQWISRGKEYVTLPSSTALKNIGAMICLESTYPQISRGLSRSGASALVCISNDTAFGNSMIPYIHTASMVFRAIENNKYGVHVGNTGPSIICDNKGRIITQIPYGKTAYANAVISPIN